MNNVVKKFKEGHKIHIKEKNKGTFTKWCGGNVTDECILRGKNSSNPKIRKKATFADNARKWKHLLGGTIDWNSLASNILNASVLTYANNKKIDAATKQANADLDKKYSLMIQSLLELNKEKQREYYFNWAKNIRDGLTLENMSPVALKHFGQNSIGLQMGNAKDLQAKDKKAVEDAATSEKAANYALLFGTAANTALNAFGLYMLNKQYNSVPKTTTLSYNAPITPSTTVTGSNGSINYNYNNVYSGTNGSLRVSPSLLTT